METQPKISLTSYRHICAILSIALITIWSLAAISGLGFWVTLGASLIFCALIGLYVIIAQPAAILPPRVDVSLREQARLAAGFDEALVIISQSQQILYANDAARSLLGLKDENSKVSDLIDDINVLTLVRQTLEGNTLLPLRFTARRQWNSI